MSSNTRREPVGNEEVFLLKPNVTKLLTLFVATIAVAACGDSPTNARQDSNSVPLFAASHGGGPLDVREVRMDLPPHPRPWDTSDVALVAAVAAESGNAVIAIKEPASPHVREAGLRGAVSATTVTRGLDLLRGLGVQIVSLYDAIGAVHVRMDPALAPILKANPLVDYIEPRQWRRIQGVPGMDVLAFLPLGTPQTVPWGIQLVRASDAWTVTRGTGAKIYLIDTGMDTTHEDLPHPPASHCGGAYGGCDDAFPIPHGTHVMGIWTARDNTVGVEGVAPGVNPADIYLWGACSSDTGNCPTTEVINGLNAAIFDADVINMSFGSTGYDQGEANAVAQAWNYNIVLVAAAGNNQGNTILYPANYAHVIGVSGVLPDKSFASTSPCTGASSNWGSDVDLAAPFYALSTVPGGYDDESGGWCGTSMATPHVSGAAALVRAHNPTWTNQQIVNQLFNTAQDLGATGWDDHFGHGLVDAANALGVAPPPPPLSVAISGPSVITRKGTYTWTASASGGLGHYTYQWNVDYDSGFHYALGTGAAQSLTVYSGDGNFTMSVAVTSFSAHANASFYVYECISGGSNCVPRRPVGGG